ncbi:WbqC family protein [Candidatus Woesearchaeota archaeon]|jgi:hypothetical protein|nr:WbqC family protein [Candidatus Woesearchaeota archaeon]
MIVTIHQPEHLPYFGFLDKVNKADVFVILDDVQFKKNNFQNRNQILTPHGVKWLSVPVEIKHVCDKNINARKIVGNWKQDYRNKLIDAYKNHPFFDETLLWIDEVLAINSDNLIDYNLSFIKHIFKLLEISPKIVFSSELKITSSKSQRILDICKKMSATDYLAGQGAIDYLDVNIFDNINIIKHKFIHPEYVQFNCDKFIPYMSSIDFFMNIGKNNFKQLLHSLKSNSV